MRPKCYSYSVEKGDGQNKIDSRHKGLMKAVISSLSLQNYRDSLNRKNSSVIMEQKKIQIKNYHATTVREKRKCLNSFDDKRFTCPDNVKTLPFGHPDIALKLSFITNDKT